MTSNNMIKGLEPVLSIVQKSMFKCAYAECHSAECRFAESHYIKCHYAECRSLEPQHYHQDTHYNGIQRNELNYDTRHKSKKMMY